MRRGTQVRQDAEECTAHMISIELTKEERHVAAY